MDGNDTTGLLMADKLSPTGIAGLPPAPGSAPGRGAAALVFGLSAMAAATAVLLSPRIIDSVEHAAHARQVAVAQPRLDRAAPVVAAPPPQPFAPSTEPAADASPADPNPPAPAAVTAENALPAAPEPTPAVAPKPAPDPAATESAPPTARTAALVAPNLIATPDAPPAPPEPLPPSQEAPALDQPPVPVATARETVPPLREPDEPRRETPGTSVGALDGAERDAAQRPEPQPVQPEAPSVIARLIPPQPFPRQSPVSPPPGLLLVARQGDTLQRLYKSVYSGVRPPPFQEIVDANPSPLRPGIVLVFPTPPDGWRRP